MVSRGMELTKVRERVGVNFDACRPDLQEYLIALNCLQQGQWNEALRRSERLLHIINDPFNKAAEE